MHRSPHARSARPSTTRPRAAALVVASVIAASLALGACSGQDSAPSSSSASASPSSASASASISPTPSPSPSSPYGIPPGASPFSGEPGGADKPVLAVKIDNTGKAQPHSGLTAADLVYMEEVEWGLTRLCAIFSTNLPKEIGPVRSARISDIDLLAQFGKIAFANSGSQSKLLPLLAKANLVDVSANTLDTYYTRDPNRAPPVNDMIDPTVLLKHAQDVATAKDIGFVFSDTPPPGGQPVKSLDVKWDDASVSFTWDEKSQGFIVGFDGKESQSVEGGPQVAKTVVIQQVEQADSGFGDRYGGKTPLITTVGTGSAIVMRNGKLWSTKWSRPTPESGTTFTLADGMQMPFAIGQEWIVLLDKKRSPIIR